MKKLLISTAIVLTSINAIAEDQTTTIKTTIIEVITEAATQGDIDIDKLCKTGSYYSELGYGDARNNVKLSDRLSEITDRYSDRIQRKAFTIMLNYGRSLFKADQNIEKSEVNQRAYDICANAL